MEGLFCCFWNTVQDRVSWSMFFYFLCFLRHLSWVQALRIVVSCVKLFCRYWYLGELTSDDWTNLENSGLLGQTQIKRERRNYLWSICLGRTKFTTLTCFSLHMFPRQWTVSFNCGYDMKFFMLFFSLQSLTDEKLSIRLYVFINDQLPMRKVMI